MLFTSEINKKEITFLDLKITTDLGGCIHTNVYRKSTSTNGFLQWQSHQPTPLKLGIPIGQYLLAWRNCSTEEAFKKECRNVYQRFVDRGYPKKHLRGAYKRAKQTNKEDLLGDVKIVYKTGPTNQIVRCIGTFDSHAPKMMNILKRHLAYSIGIYGI